MARITWQNVAAPNLGASASAIRTAGHLVGSAFDKFGTTVRTLEKNQNDKASSKAMSEALKFGSADELQGFLSQNGVQGLGARPGQLNDTAIDFLANRGTTLLQDVQRKENIEGTDLSNNWFQTNSQWDHDMRVRTDARNEASRDLGMWATTQADKIGRTAPSLEEAQLDITNNPNFNPLQRDALSTALAANSDYFKVGADSTAAASGLTPVQNLTADINAQGAEIDRDYSTNMPLRIFDAAQQNFSGYGDPAAKIVENFRSLNQDLDEEAIASTSGHIRGAYNDLKAEFPGVAPEMVAQVVSNELKQTGWLGFGNDSQKVSKDAARKVLQELASPKSQQMLQVEGNNVRQRREAHAENQRLLTDAQGDYALAHERNDQAGMASAMQALQKLSGNFVAQPGQPVAAGVQSPPPGPSSPAFGGVLGQASTIPTINGAPAPTTAPSTPALLNPNQGANSINAAVQGFATPPSARAPQSGIQAAAQLVQDVSRGRAGAPEPYPSSDFSTLAQDAVTTALEIGKDPDEIQAIAKVADGLKTGIDPYTNKPMTAAMRKNYEQVVADFEKEAQTFYEKLGMGGNR